MLDLRLGFLGPLLCLGPNKSFRYQSDVLRESSERFYSVLRAPLLSGSGFWGRDFRGRDLLPGCKQRGACFLALSFSFFL